MKQIDNDACLYAVKVLQGGFSAESTKIMKAKIAIEKRCEELRKEGIPYPECWGLAEAEWLHEFLLKYEK